MNPPPRSSACHALLFASLLAVGTTISGLAALDVRLEKIVEIPPQGAGDGLGVPWVIDGQVCFGKMDRTGPSENFGIYSAGGGALLLWGTTLDGAEVGSGSIADVDGSSFLVEGSSTYMPNQPNTGYNAIFLFPGGTRILDRNTAYPGYPVPHPSNVVGLATLDSGRVAMTLRGSSLAPAQPSAICVYQGGAVSLIVKEGDFIPGTTTKFSAFDGFTRPYAEGGTVVFAGRGTGRAGIFEWDGGGLRVVVDQSTPAPQGGTLGSTFDPRGVVKQGRDFAFITGSSANQLYKLVNGTLTLVANNQTPMPGGVGKFAIIDYPTLRDGHVVFVGWRDSQFSPPREYGIYTDVTGTIEPIVDLHTDFGGKTAHTFSMNTGKAWVGDSVYFMVRFDDGSNAIYKAAFAPGGSVRPVTLKSTALFLSPTSGTITVPSRTEYVYRLISSPGLDGGGAVSSQNGTGGSLAFTFSVESPAPPSRFFWVEERPAP